MPKTCVSPQVTAVSAMNDAGVGFFITDLPAPQLVEVARETRGRALVLLNISAPDDSLRAEQCQAHLLHVVPSYAMLSGERTKQVSLDFSQFARGPKDMLDAAVAAFTVGEYLAGRGEAVGDDGLGTIILPRPLPDSTSGELLRWPAKS